MDTNVQNNVMKFEGKEVEVFEWNGKVLFNPRHVGECLGLGESAVRMATSKMNEKQVIKLTNLDVKEIDIRKLNNAGENFLTESGVYKLIFKSHKEEAERFQDWVTDEVLPSIRNKGSYDAIDNSLDLIKDETEKLLKKGIYQLEKVLEIMPNDIVTSIHLSQKRNELDTYLQSKKLAEINAQLEKQTRILTEQGQKLETTEQRVDNFMTIGDRQSFVREVNSVARATGKRQTEVYGLVYNTLKDMYGIDLYARARNYRENMQDKRIAEGKKPYSESTLNQKCSCLAIAEEKELFPQLGKALFSVRDSLLKEKKQK